jgi:signal transduction histidine kinase/CheY-like chemotaxis protein
MILARLRKGERVDHYETVRMRKDGGVIDVSVTISVIKDPSGRIIAASKIARDISDRKKVERELQEAKELAEAASRAKDEFLSALSHELRTPLTPVLAAISFIENDPHLSPDEIRGHVGMIRRNIENEARLVDDLLDLTRISRGKVKLHFEVVDAHAVLRNAVAIFSPDIDRKGLELTVALRAKDHHVWADPARLHQVFLNLLSNAIKFTPEGGAVTLRSSNPGEGGGIAFDVSDTGIGIDAELLPRLFSPFEQGEQTITRRFGGLGLGLSIVRSLVEMHQGTIAVSSQGLNQGATFVLELGTVPPIQAPGSGPAPAKDQMPACRILLVEDHEDTRMVMTRLLKSFGFTVAAAGSVREALQLAGTTRFDLLLSDIGLPDGSGIDLMRHLKDRQGIKGIALSGFGQDDDIRRSREAGFETHLTKPVNFQTLQQVIMRVSGSN